MKDTPTNNPKRPLEERRTLIASNAAGKVLWDREIRAPVHLPLRR